MPKIKRLESAKRTIGKFNPMNSTRERMTSFCWWRFFIGRWYNQYGIKVKFENLIRRNRTAINWNAST